MIRLIGRTLVLLGALAINAAAVDWPAINPGGGGGSGSADGTGGWETQSSTQTVTVREVVIGSSSGVSNLHPLEIDSGAGPAAILLNKSSVGPGWLHGVTIRVQGVTKGTFGFDDLGGLGLTGSNVTGTATQVFSVNPASSTCCGGFTTGTGGMNLGQAKAGATFEVRYSTDSTYALAVSSIPDNYLSVVPTAYDFYVTTGGQVYAASGFISGGTGPLIQISTADTSYFGVNGDTDVFKIHPDSATIDGVDILKKTQRDLWTNADYINTSTNAYNNGVSTYPFYNQAKFDPGVSTATNRAFLKWFSGANFDTGIVPSCVFSDMKDAVDTSTRGYIVSIASVSAGDVLNTLTFSNIIRVKVTNTSVGGQGASAVSASTSLTGWNSFIASNTQYVIQVAREGDSAVMDPSTVGSYFNQFFLSYGTTQ